MNRKKMEDQNQPNIKGMTLIELLIGMIICAMVIAGIYRVFIAQTKAYTVQDQVVEVQQSVRSAMEIMLRDLRMTGFDFDNLNSPITITTPIETPLSDNAIKVSYEYYDKNAAQYQKHTVAYWRDAASSTMFRQLAVNDVKGLQEPLLENVDEFSLTYGVDSNEDGALDDRNGDGVITGETFPVGDFLPAGAVGTSKVVAVRITLTARPIQVNPDVKAAVSPRKLVSMVTLRNLCLVR